MGPDVVVPEGHSVTVFGIRADPVVEDGPGGLVVAHLGAGIDDPDELTAVIKQARAVLGRACAAAHFVRRATAISDLFEPNPLDGAEAAHGIVWTVAQDGLWSTLADAGARERFLAELRTIDAPQWLVVDGSWETDDEFEAALREASVEVLQARNGPVLVEVRRPGGERAVGFVAGPCTPTAKRGAPRPLVRAPRLRRLLLDALDSGATPSLVERLLDRPYKLLFFVDTDGTAQMTTWPDQPDPYLPVFGDLTTLQRTAHETGRPPNSFAIGGLTATELLAWARDSRFGIALNVFADSGQAHYIPIRPRGER
jgi:hypothetical protein